MTPGLAVRFDATLNSAWFVPAYTTGCALGFIFAGANSDIFGRRLFLLMGNIFACIGFSIAATATGSAQLIAGLATTGYDLPWTTSQKYTTDDE